MKTLLYTAFALVAFAANSVLCRLALGGELIDAASFTVIRLLSGALVLGLVLAMSGSKVTATKGSWGSALMLLVYAISFSYAYLSLDTATGALVLFGAVQITIILLSLFSGNRLSKAEWLGVAMAFGGFVYLVFPNLTTPSFSGFVLMALAGIGWGIYTLRGRGSAYPLADTTYNFIRTVPVVVLLLLWALPDMQLSAQGVLLAGLSGAVASGIGYSIWYAALGGFSATEAGVVQLLVPVIAAIGGLVFVNEAISLRLVLAAAMILGGILMVVMSRYYLGLDKSA